MGSILPASKSPPSTGKSRNWKELDELFISGKDAVLPNALCDVCQNLLNKLLLLEWSVVDFIGYEERVEHDFHADLQEIIRSALGGCHFCTLLLHSEWDQSLKLSGKISVHRKLSLDGHIGFNLIFYSPIHDNLPGLHFVEFVSRSPSEYVGGTSKQVRCGQGS